MTRDFPRTPKPTDDAEVLPFESVDQAWFWFIQAQQARVDGARLTQGLGMIPRPCQPLDILQVLDRLYRQRELTMDHLMVLRHYGRRLMPPDPRRPKEIKSWRLWTEAMARMAPIFEKKGIIKSAGPFAPWIVERNVISIDLYREAAE